MIILINMFSQIDSLSIWC